MNWFRFLPRGAGPVSWAKGRGHDVRANAEAANPAPSEIKTWAFGQAVWLNLYPRGQKLTAFKEAWNKACPYGGQGKDLERGRTFD